MRETLKAMAVLAGVGFVLVSGAAYAGGSDDVAGLKQLVQEQNDQIQMLLRRIEALESGQERQDAKIDEAKEEAEKSAVPSWVEKVKWSGDLRYRHEWIDQENRDDRNRHRIRARLKLAAEVNDEFDLTFQLASGSSDPVSANQTLDTSFTSKDIWIDLAYFDYHPSYMEGLNVYGGKVKNPFITPGGTELIWDGDLRPEGISVTYAHNAGDLTLSTNLGGFWVEERSSDADTSLWGAQLALKYKFMDGDAYLMGGLSYYDYGNIYDRGPLVGGLLGNIPFIDTATYHDDYDLFEAFLEAGFHVMDIPVSVFGDYVINTSADCHGIWWWDDCDDDDDTGWLVGFKVGKCKKPGSWEFKYNYRDVERNAVVGAFTDSDFAGGGTDGEGHELGIGYQLMKNVKAGVSYFNCQRAVTLADLDYQRLQLDLKLKF